MQKRRRREDRKAQGDPSGDVLPCRHCNLLYKLHVSSAARLKTSSSMYQSPVNCWVNFPLTLVLWFITLLQIWHCQSKCSGRVFADWTGVLFCYVLNDFSTIHQKEKRKRHDMLCFPDQTVNKSFCFLFFFFFTVTFKIFKCSESWN